jgi:hypothetical protein
MAIKSPISIIVLFIPLSLSAFTHLWNPIGYQTEPWYDEAIYLGRAMYLLQGAGPQEFSFYDHPYFGQIFLAGVYSITGFSSFHIPNNGDSKNVLFLYLVPRVAVGILAIIDTLLVYKIGELKYNRKVGLIASILFAVMPLSSYLRLILLDPIQLPFFLTSIVIPLYIIKRNRLQPMSTRRTTCLVLASGVAMGIAIFTKIPIFTAIPLVGYLVSSCSNNKLKTVGLWILPVLIIPLIWPLYATFIGEWRYWVAGVLFQTHRESQRLINSIGIAFQTDNLLVILGIVSVAYYVIKRDYFMILWVFPILIFFYSIGYVAYWYLIPLIPIVSLTGGRLIVDLSEMVHLKYIQKVLPYGIVTVVGLFGLASTFALVAESTSFHYFESVAFVGKYLQDLSDSKDNNKELVVISEPTYTWVLERVFHLNYTFDALAFSTINVTKAILIVDKAFINDMSRVGPASANLRDVYNGSTLVTKSGEYPMDSVSIRLYDVQLVASKNNSRNWSIH